MALDPITNLHKMVLFVHPAKNVRSTDSFSHVLIEGCATHVCVNTVNDCA